MFFVSSWTLQDGEQSGQWHRYGDASSGVRISFDTAPFGRNRLDLNLVRSLQQPRRDRASYSDRMITSVGFTLDGVIAPYPKEVMFGNGYVLVPDSHDMSNFGGNVIYVEDPRQFVADIVDSSGERTTVYGRGSNAARVKHIGWSDQLEHRFVLMAVAGPNLDYSADTDAYEHALLDQIEEHDRTGISMRPADVPFIDLPFPSEALHGLTITLGPNISSEDRDAVLLAINECAPRAKVLESGLKVRAVR